MPVTKEEFRQLLRNAADEEFADVPAEREIPYEFSADFYSKCDKLVARQKIWTWRMFNTACKRAAVIAAAAVLLLMTACSMEPVREVFVTMVNELTDKGNIYTVEGTSQDEIDEIAYRYTLTQIPVGFRQSFVYDSDEVSSITYKKDQRESLMFMQMLIKAGSKKSFEVGEAYGEGTTAKVGDRTVQLYESDFGRAAIWVEDVYMFWMTYNGEISEREFKSLILSVK